LPLTWARLLGLGHEEGAVAAQTARRNRSGQRGFSARSTACWTLGSVAGTLFMLMANAISVHTTLESENLRIPELLPFVGKKVQIIVVEDDPVQADTARERDAEAAAGSPALPKRTLGSLHGLLRVPEDFDDPLPEDLMRAFEGDG
jgi:hypothetical protein